MQHGVRSMLFLMVAAVACGGGTPVTDERARSPGGGDMRVIVDNVVAVWRPGHAWQLAEEPAVVIGGDVGVPMQELFRVTDALRTNGEIVVANSGTSEIRFYDARGRHVRSVGRAGDGPAEFRLLYWVRPWPGDSIVAYDFLHRRLTFFDAQGGYGRDVSVVNAGWQLGTFSVEGIFDDGSVLVSAAPANADPRPPAGLSRSAERLFHVTVDGEFSADSVGWARLHDRVTVAAGDKLLSMVAHFSPTSYLTVAGEKFYLGFGDKYEIGEYATAGDLRRVIRKEHANARVTDAIISDIREAEEERLSRMDDAGDRAFACSYR